LILSQSIITVGRDLKNNAPCFQLYGIKTSSRRSRIELYISLATAPSSRIGKRLLSFVSKP